MFTVTRIRQYLAGRYGKRIPLKDPPLRVAGQGVAEKRREAISGENMQLGYSIGIIVSAFAFTAIMRFPFRIPWTYCLLVFAAALLVGIGVLVLTVIEMIRGMRSNTDLRLGYLAECLVGQRLEETRAFGACVFHDIERGEGKRTFNIDHLVVAQSGIYVIETKARSKPGKGPTEARLQGERIIFSDGNHYEDEPIRQVKANADDMRDLLTELLRQRRNAATRFTRERPMPIIPVVVYPGWYIPTQRPDGLNPILSNEKMLLATIRTRQQLLQPAEVQELSTLLDSHLRNQNQDLLEW